MFNCNRLSINFFKAFSILMVVILSLLTPAASWAQSADQVVIHYVEGEPLADGVGYAVRVFISLFDSSGNPIKELKPGNVSVTEDSQSVSVERIDSAMNEPINVILLMDTSYSMFGEKMQSALAAAQDFASGVRTDDKISVLTFDNQVNEVLDFTNDRKTAADRIGLIEVNPSGGTCMFDAAYSAAEMAATLPPGRRAIILLSDGYDETTPGIGCSIHTIEDVIKITGSGSTRVPIHTIGLGDTVDEKSLQRMADMSGGVFRAAPAAAQLGQLFDLIEDQLRSEYVLSYISSGTPGPHTVVVKSGSRQDSREFMLPALPAQAKMAFPSEGQEISGKIKLTASVVERGEPVGSVVFKINNTVVGSVEKAPYEFEVDLTDYNPGNIRFTVTALSPNGKELTTDTITAEIIDPQKEITPSATTFAGETPEATPTDGGTGGGTDISLFLIIGGAVLALGLILFFVLRKKKPKEEDVVPSLGLDGGDATMDGIMMPGFGTAGALGKLVVIRSDDETMEGHVFEIVSFPVRMGRSGEMDVILSAKDRAVSRKHAMLEEEAGKVVLREIITRAADGSKKPPAYGTFINGNKLSEDERVELATGDEIRLGSRTTLRFERVQAVEAEAEGEATMDNLDISGYMDTTEVAGDDDSTQEVL